MSDVIAAAAITAAVALVGSITTYLASRDSRRQETARRKEARAEADRSLRREKYADLAWLLYRLQKYNKLGYEPDQQEALVTL